MNEAGVSWSIVIAAFSIIVSAIGGLVALVWGMHNKRVDSIDKRVDENQKNVDEKFENQRKLSEMRDTKIFEKLDRIHENVQESATSVADLRAEIAQGYVSKPDCNSIRADCKHKG